MKFVTTHLKDKPLPGFTSSLTEIIVMLINSTGTRLAYLRTDKSVRIWRSSQERFVDPVIIEDPHTKAVSLILWDPLHEQQFATVGRDDVLKIWRSLGKCERVIRAKAGTQLKFVRYSLDGKLLVTVDRESNLTVYKTDNFKVLVEKAVGEHVYDIQWFKNDYFCTALQNGTMRVYKLERENSKESSDVMKHEDSNLISLRGTLSGHMSSITTCSVDPCGKYLVAGSNEGVVSFWSIALMLNTKVITLVDEAISCVSTSRDGGLIAVAYDAGSNIRIFDSSTSELVWEVPNSESGEVTFTLVTWFPNKTGIFYSGDNGRSAMVARRE